MQVIYQLVPQDYDEVPKAFRRDRWSRWSLVFMFAFEILIGLVWLTSLYWDSTRNTFKNLTPLVVGMALLLILTCTPYLTRWTIGRQLQKTPSAKFPITLTASESGLRFHSEQSETTHQWSAFLKWTEEKTVFALFLGPKFCHVIPKRAFCGEELDRFRGMLRNKIPAQ